MFHRWKKKSVLKHSITAAALFKQRWTDRPTYSMNRQFQRTRAHTDMHTLSLSLLRIFIYQNVNFTLQKTWHNSIFIWIVTLDNLNDIILLNPWKHCWHRAYRLHIILSHIFDQCVFRSLIINIMDLSSQCLCWILRHVSPLPTSQPILQPRIYCWRVLTFIFYFTKCPVRCMRCFNKVMLPLCFANGPRQSLLFVRPQDSVCQENMARER